MDNSKLGQYRNFYRQIRTMALAFQRPESLNFIDKKGFDALAKGKLGFSPLALKNPEDNALRYVKAASEIFADMTAQFQSIHNFKLKVAQTDLDREELESRFDAREQAYEYAGVDNQDLAEFWANYED
jgi:hypothetical protein